MSLSDLIQKKKSRTVATLTDATNATLGTDKVVTVAKVANVTVATPSKSPKDTSCLERFSGTRSHPGFPRRVPPLNADDRRYCSQCANLSAGGHCLSASRGEIEADSHYKPVDNCPRRCIGYAPKTNDPNQRTGTERWPGLIPIRKNHGKT